MEQTQAHTVLFANQPKTSVGCFFVGTAVNASMKHPKVVNLGCPIQIKRVGHWNLESSKYIGI